MDESSLVTANGDILGTVRGVFTDLMNFRLLDKKLDAEIARPFFVNDMGGGQYALGANGQLYVRGTSAGIFAAPTSATMQSLLMVGLVVGGVILLVNAMKG